jgi:tetratricopeptide (TPR) repeat protein
MPRGGLPGNKGGSGKLGNKGGAAPGNKGGSGSPGNKGGGAASGNANASSAQTKARKLLDEAGELHHHGNLTSALDKYEAALKINPELCAAHNNIGMILGNLFAAGDVLAGPFSRIREHFEKAHLFGCSVAGRNLCVLRFIGEHGLKNDPQEHVDDCQFIMDNMKPASAAEHHMFARCILACRTVETHNEAIKLAEDHLRLAVELDPSSSVFMTCFGAVLAARGISGEATEVFATVLKKRPKYLYAADMLEKLSSEVLRNSPTIRYFTACF